MLRVVRGGQARGAMPNARVSPGQADAVLDERDLVVENVTDDPAARRRELAVVLELCAARSRGAFDLPRTHDAEGRRLRGRRFDLTIGHETSEGPTA